MGKPDNTPNQALAGVLLAFKGQRLVVFRRRRHCIFQNAGTIWCHGRSLISVREMETFNQIGSKARLIEVDSDGRRGNKPGEVDPKNQFTIPMKSTLHCSARSRQNRASTAGSLEKYTKSLMYKPNERGHLDLALDGSKGS
jgi:hypothetical protein